MKIHSQGFPAIFIALAVSILLLIISYVFLPAGSLILLILVALLIINAGIILFFRVPARISKESGKAVFSPADGRVVAIEEITEDEYFHDKRLQVSIFMSVWNVHVNWYPVSGTIAYSRYHPGKYLIARHPKSSLLNERNTTVIRTASGEEILVRQIAGAVARRIFSTAEKNRQVSSNDQLGIIRFGSRLDVILPHYYLVNVELNQQVKGNQSIIASSY